MDCDNVSCSFLLSYIQLNYSDNGCFDLEVQSSSSRITWTNVTHLNLSMS